MSRPRCRVVGGVGRIHRVDEVQDFVRAGRAARLVDDDAQRGNRRRQAVNPAQRRAAHVYFQRQVINIVAGIQRGVLCCR